MEEVDWLYSVTREHPDPLSPKKGKKNKTIFMLQMENAVALGSLNDNEWDGSGCRVGGRSVWEAMNDKVLHGRLAWRER